MATFLVIVTQSGPEFDRLRRLGEQSGWDEHAAFMDALAESGFIVLGGPLDGGPRVAHLVEADSDEAVRATLARDPWNETHLRIASVEPWEIRLRSSPS